MHEEPTIGHMVVIISGKWSIHQNQQRYFFKTNVILIEKKVTVPDVLSDPPRNPPKQPVSVGLSDCGGGEDLLDTLTHRVDVQTTPNRNQVDKPVKGTNQDLCDTFNLGDIYIFPGHTPEESSLDIGPSHVDPHVVGLVHQDVVLGAGGQPVAEPHPVLPDVSVTRRLGQ